MPSASDLTAIRRFLDALSWKKIAQLAAFLFVIVSGWVTFEMREPIYNFIVQSRIQKSQPSVLSSISKKTASVIDSMVIQSPLIIGISIVNVDFQRNLRTIIYTSIDDNGLKAEYDKVYVSTSLPLFDTNVSNNKRLVGIINGEFICSPYADTVSAETAPATKKYIQTACISGIPPYYGAFSGIVNIYLTRQPTPEEVDQIRVLSRNISVLVYDSDFK